MPQLVDHCVPSYHQYLQQDPFLTHALLQAVALQKDLIPSNAPHSNAKWKHVRAKKTRSLPPFTLTHRPRTDSLQPLRTRRHSTQMHFSKKIFWFHPMQSHQQIDEDVELLICPKSDPIMTSKTPLDTAKRPSVTLAKVAASAKAFVTATQIPNYMTLKRSRSIVVPVPEGNVKDRPVSKTAAKRTPTSKRPSSTFKLEAKLPHHNQYDTKSQPQRHGRLRRAAS
ncbi:hypothetical protein HK102_003354, partial [Quaeritorhiza haematococci]